ncbi:PREDICTED: uncharacterized protein C12orf50 homolog, partial [Merops nubicus]|uniref:uncharacterized protein C12orf50 homolog n=1 Tax=Merops nubicus TaxID=57421 RepID=UPI0004F0AE66
QKDSSIPCYWERQPAGCLRIRCAFHHSKPRYINGLFLPPSSNTPLQQVVQEGSLRPAHNQIFLRKQEKFSLPVHPPVIINLKDESEAEEDDEEEEKSIPDWRPKTTEDIEEERKIKEICYKSGDYYRIQRPHQPTKAVSPPRGKELFPSEAKEKDVQKVDGSRIPTKSDHTEKEKGNNLGRR